MNKPAIQVQDLSKAYQIGKIGTGTISRDLERFWLTRVMGKEDPFLKIGETNDRSRKGASDIVWSLQDLNFTIFQGDAVGIIGKNGAGKSTLLKLLSRVTSPTKGEIKVKGRIASLLEVGTGFHPELSGRENIFLNGAILGMRKKEIASKLDEIIDFSGVERYIDTPVKRYSSGMYVRLAFAVAAHLESEILIVDEVLAVGDAEFQKKCLGKMSDISRGEGRTVLFVSHNLQAVQNLCSTAMLLVNGQLRYKGSVDKTIDLYLGSQSAVSSSTATVRINSSDSFTVTHAVFNQAGEQRNSFSSGEDLLFELYVDAETVMDFKNYVFELKITDVLGNILATASTHLSGFLVKSTAKSLTLQVLIKNLNLIKGNYSVNLVVVHYHNTANVFLMESFSEIEIIDTLRVNLIKEVNARMHGNLALDAAWKIT
jgi:lipopolysaccharide transport system ATP-binding protein